MDPAGQPLIVGIGGSTRATSLTDELLRAALAATEARGARTVAFGGRFLAELPIYAADDGLAGGDADELARAVAAADGVIIATPGYHGGMSGLVKNALDHLEALRDDERPYLSGRPVGTIVTAAGWQACGTTLVSLRSTVHALRGWPTPYGATINTAEPVFDEGGNPLEQVGTALQLVADQVVDFATR
ncbi:MAG TPA: NADPH-dependent FMN reductase [Jatrophihabitantaceae bacterium]|jgi:FMN reductase